jgi:tripartite-type tricarboxylate transporter receptor subunit TctC
LREQGLANVVGAGWYGFMAPAATPREIVARLEAEVVRALADPEVKKKLLVQGLEPRPGSAAAFGKFIDDETRKWSELIREAGLKGE